MRVPSEEVVFRILLVVLAIELVYIGYTVFRPEGGSKTHASRPISSPMAAPTRYGYGYGYGYGYRVARGDADFIAHSDRGPDADGDGKLDTDTDARSDTRTERAESIPRR